jgi:hypothetical protein
MIASVRQLPDGEELVVVESQRSSSFGSVNPRERVLDQRNRAAENAVDEAEPAFRPWSPPVPKRGNA